MRILSVHNRYQVRGGEEECHQAEVDLLHQRGHQIEVYEETNDRINALGKRETALRILWSQEAYQTVRKRLQKHPSEIVHIHNFFPLISPSVYYAAKAEGVPVVQTLHNYRLLCPNALFFRKGRVCEDCLGKPIPYPGIVHACYRNNRAATTSVATMLSLHRAIQTWHHTIDRYIAPTEFARQKFIQGGLPADKIVVKPNFVDPDPGVGQGLGGYALFVGRLSVEKGLDTLLAAWQQLQSPIALKIVGDGPLAQQVAAYQSNKIEYLGRKSMAEVLQLMGNALFLIFPSKWYETSGRVAIEAFAKGTPVIAANIGALAELTDHGRIGLRFQPGDAKDLATQVQWAIDHPHELAAMRQQARAEFEAKYTAERNYQRLMDIYSQVRLGG